MALSSSDFEGRWHEQLIEGTELQSFGELDQGREPRIPLAELDVPDLDAPDASARRQVVPIPVVIETQRAEAAAQQRAFARNSEGHQSSDGKRGLRILLISSHISKCAELQTCCSNARPRVSLCDRARPRQREQTAVTVTRDTAEMTVTDLEIRVKRELTNNGPLGASELAKRLAVDKESVSRPVWNLIDRGELELTWTSGLRVVPRPTGGD
jgi:hypothetical protein